MKEIYLAAQIENGQMVWIASASNHEGVIEFDSATVSTRTLTPLDAMTLLAQELYEEVQRLTKAYDFEHPEIEAGAWAGAWALPKTDILHPEVPDAH